MRTGHRASNLHANVTVSGLTVGGALSRESDLHIPGPCAPQLADKETRSSHVSLRPRSGHLPHMDLTAGDYILYRYDGTASLPKSASAADTGFTAQMPFTATVSTWAYSDPKTFKSNTAVYYVAVKASKRPAVPVPIMGAAKRAQAESGPSGSYCGSVPVILDDKITFNGD